MTSSVIRINPKLDLVLERELDVPVELVWKAWTTPQHLREWFAPKPWTITACDLDLRPGGGRPRGMKRYDPMIRHRDCAPPPQVAELRAKTTLFARSTLGRAGRPDPAFHTRPATRALRAP